MHFTALATSAELAAEVGPFAGFAPNREAMLRVVRNHRRAAYGAPEAEYEGLTVTPVTIDPAHCAPELLAAARATPTARSSWASGTATATPRCR
jgi:ribonucleoside-diphosphate reductase alpha chain